MFSFVHCLRKQFSETASIYKPSILAVHLSDPQGKIQNRPFHRVPVQPYNKYEYWQFQGKDDYAIASVAHSTPITPGGTLYILQGDETDTSMEISFDDHGNAQSAQKNLVML